jgi:hypothetical protein
MSSAAGRSNRATHGSRVPDRRRLTGTRAAQGSMRPIWTRASWRGRPAARSRSIVSAAFRVSKPAAWMLAQYRRSRTRRGGVPTFGDHWGMQDISARKPSQHVGLRAHLVVAGGPLADRRPAKQKGSLVARQRMHRCSGAVAEQWTVGDRRTDQWTPGHTGLERDQIERRGALTSVHHPRLEVSRHLGIPDHAADFTRPVVAWPSSVESVWFEDAEYSLLAPAVTWRPDAIRRKRRQRVGP